MAENVQVQLNVRGGGEAARTAGGIKQELRNATQQAIALARQFGELSPEAQAAAERVAELRDEIADLNERVQLADPGARFQVFGNAIKSVAGGFSAVQGAMAAFGAESEDLQKTMVKLQGAMALSEGLSTIADSWKDFERLGAVIKTNVVKAFTTLRGAIIATGIGALLVALGLVIANFEKIEAWIKKLFPAFEGFGKLFDKVKAIAMGALNAIIESFKILGDIIADIFKGDFKAAAKEAAGAGKRMADAYVQGFNDEVADQMQEAARKATEALIKQQENDLKVLRAYGATREKEAAALELAIAKNKVKVIDTSNKEGQDAQAAAFADLQALQIQQSQQEGQRLLKALQDRQALQMQALQDAGKDTIGLQEKQLQAQLALQKKYGLETRDTIQAIRQAQEADRKARFDKELADLITAQDLQRKAEDIAGKNIFHLQEQQLNAQLELYKKYGYSLKEVQDRQAQEELDRRKKLNDALQTSIGKHQETVLINVGEYQQKLADSQKQKDIETQEREENKQKLYQSTIDAMMNVGAVSEQMSDIESAAGAASAAIIAFGESQKQDAFGKTADALAAASQILGQQTAQGKAIAIASTTISTYESAMLAYRNGQMVGGPWGIALGIAAAAAAVVAGISRVRQIASVKVPGVGAVSTPNISAAANGVSIPTVRGTSNTMVDQLAQVNTNLQQPQRVYVVERDITDTQARVADIEANAQF